MSQSPTADREIVIKRVLNAPREMVWAVWTDPKHVKHWWGPNGFTNTIHEMSVKPGGVWRFIMHGPDGTNYPNKIVFNTVKEPELLEYDHGEDDDGPVHFKVRVTFEAQGKQTLLTMYSIFPTAAARDFVVKEYGAIEGGNQTINHLEEYLKKMPTDTTGDKPFIITRTFDAPRDLVWKAWTERDRLVQWFGPKGLTMPYAKLDFRPGGMLHYRMETPDGKVMWGKFVYREIEKPSRLVWVNSFSDENAGLTSHPFSSDPWPLEMLTTVTFTEQAGKTTVNIEWIPVNPTEAERQTFYKNFAGMNMGWGGTFEQLTDYLAKNKA